MSFLAILTLARSVIKAIPWQAWIAILVAAAFLLAIHNRNHWKHVATERQAELAQLHSQVDAADRAARQAEAQASKISQQLRNRTDEENSRIAGDARTLSLRGPGKAICTAVPASPGGHEQGPPNTDVAGPALPTDDRAAVPWPWLVTRAQEHDELLNEVTAWRTWHDEVLKVWPKTGK